MANRVLLGKDGNGDYCLKVSASGANVLTTSNLTFNSLITDSTSGVTSTEGRAFNVIQSGVINGSGTTAATYSVQFPSIVDNSGNYSIPFVHALYEKTVTETNIAAGYYTGYGYHASGTFSWGAYMLLESHGFNSSGGNYTSGTQYGRLRFNASNPGNMSLSYYILAIPAHG